MSGIPALDVVIELVFICLLYSLWVRLIQEIGVFRKILFHLI